MTPIKIVRAIERGNLIQRTAHLYRAILEQYCALLQQGRRASHAAAIEYSKENMLFLVVVSASGIPPF